MGSQHKGKSLRLSPGLDFPVQRRETHLVISQAAEGDGTQDVVAAGASRSRATSGSRSPDGLSRASGGEVAARGRSRGAAPPRVALLPRPGVITRAPPPRRLPPPAGHNSGNPAHGLPPGHTEAHVVWWRQPPLPPPSGHSDAASQLERGLPRRPTGGFRTGEGPRGRVGGGVQPGPGGTRTRRAGRSGLCPVRATLLNPEKGVWKGLSAKEGVGGPEHTRRFGLCPGIVFRRGGES